MTIISEILTYVIVCFAFAYAIWQVFKIVRPSKKETAGCGSGCGCDAVELRKELMARKLENH